MTPESLSREGSPSPAGEITLHAAPGVTGHGGVMSASVSASSVVQSVSMEQLTGQTICGISAGQNAINQIVGTSLEVKSPAFNGVHTLGNGNSAPRLTNNGFVNATVLTQGQPINMAGQPFHIATTVPGSQGFQRQVPQKFIVANQPGGMATGTVHHVAAGSFGQPRLIVPAQQVALLNNGGSVTNATQNIEIKKEDKMETHKIISGSLGINVSGTPVILQTSLNNIGNGTTPTYLTTDGGTVKRIFTSPVSTVGNGTTATFHPTVTVSTAPFGTPAAITGGRPPSAILTAAGVHNIPTTMVNSNIKHEMSNGGVNQQAVIVQQPPGTLFNNSNGHHPIVNFSSSPSITLIPATATSVSSTNSPVNFSGVTVTPTPLPTLSSATTNNTTMTASRMAIVMPTQPNAALNANSLSYINTAPMSSVTVSLSTAADKLQQISHPANLQKLPNSVVSINPSPAVTVVPASEASNPSFQVGSAPTRNNNFSSVEVRQIKDNDQPDSKRPRLETYQTE